MFVFLTSNAGTDITTHVAQVVWGATLLIGALVGLGFWIHQMGKGAIVSHEELHDPDFFAGAVARLLSVGMLLLFVAIGMIVGGAFGAVFGQLVMWAGLWLIGLVALTAFGVVAVRLRWQKLQNS